MKASLLLIAVTLCAAINSAHANLSHANPTNANSPMEWKFRVFLDEREIGFHDFRVSDLGATRQVEVQASFDVRFLFVSAYRYRHQNIETWDNNCLLKLESSTNDNGASLRVAGTVQHDAFLVRTDSGQSELGPCPMSFAYWNPEFLKAKTLLNAQTGILERVTVTPRGEETIAYGGEDLRANRYDLSVQGREISLWYGLEDQRWLALQTLSLIHI